jgi:SPX domain protein involved in polyphosphate accumulation
MDYRLEKKMCLDDNSFQKLKLLLDCSNHSFAEVYHNRSVSSVYFDDTSLSRYFTHVEGQPIRKKTRIRFYEELSSNKSFPLHCVLEHKIKRYNLGTKVKKKGTFDELYGEIENLSAVTAVRYIREYFEAKNGLRVTLDSGIEYAIPHVRENEIGFSNFREAMINIVEIKTPKEVRNEERDSLHSLIEKLGGRVHKFSKYCDSIEKLGLVY